MLAAKPAANAPRPKSRSCPSLLELANSLSLRRADQKLVGEGADLEQPSDLADHAAKRELALLLGRGSVGDEENAKPGAADIGDVLQVDQNRAAARLNQRSQPFAQLLRRRAVEPAIGLDDGDVVGHLFHQFHAGLSTTIPSASSKNATR